MTIFEPFGPSGPSGPNHDGARFCCTALVASANCGSDHTTFARSDASAQPQPSTGLTCWLIARNGRSPVDSVTQAMALSMTMPSAIASGWSQSIENPASTPR